MTNSYMPVESMDSNRIEVQKFLEEHFDLSGFCVNEFPVLPGGVVITDGSSYLTLYWDIERQKVKVK